jgi:hypothetical protein
MIITAILNPVGSVGDRMFLGFQDLDPKSEVPMRIRIIPFSHKGVEQTENNA